MRYCTHLYSEKYPIAFWVWSAIGVILVYGWTIDMVEKHLTKFIIKNNASLRERQRAVSTKDAQHPEIIKRIKNYEENFKRTNPWQKVGEFIDNNK